MKKLVGNVIIIYSIYPTLKVNFFKIKKIQTNTSIVIIMN